MKNILGGFLVLLALAGCTQYQAVSGGRQDIGGLYSVDPQITWSKFSYGKIDMWTVDGSELQALRFFKGLEDGDALLGGTDDKIPRFSAGMRASEVAEFVVDSLARSGGAEVESRGLRPAQFGTLPGFRFEVSFKSPEGLEIDGTAAGAVDGERLLLILYTGARQHYFPKHRDDVERVIASVQGT